MNEPILHLPRKKRRFIERRFRRQLCRNLKCDRRRWRANEITGMLDFGDSEALIKVRNLKNVLSNPPEVDSNEVWIRRETDWHYNTRGTNPCFCWVLVREWTDHFYLHREVEVEILVEDAVSWFLESTKSFLRRHRRGDIYGLSEWPPEWADYSHGSAGLQEYLKIKKAV